MKKIAYAFFAACALVPAAHALTGAQAAQLITSEPSDAYYVTPDTFELAWAYYDGGELKSTSFTIGTDSWQDDVEAAVSSLKNTVNSVALDACMALAKIEALKEVDTYLDSRVDVLTDSVKDAISQLDEVKQTDEKRGHEIETVVAKITPPDGDSIVKIGDDPGVLALRGFSGAGGSEWYVPHPRGGVLAWDSLISAFDGTTISSETTAYGPFGLTFGLKGWSTPTASPGVCVRTLSGLLHGVDPDGPHYVLTKCGDVLHYTPIGEPMEDGASVDDLSITTNRASGAVTQGKASLYGFNAVNTKAGYIPSKGEGSPAELKWLDPAEMVDNSSLALTTADGAKVWEIKGAHIYAGNHRRHYFGTGDDSALGWHELPTNDVDEASIEIHDGKLQIAGFDTAAPNSVPRKDDNGRVAWSGTSSATNTYVAGSYISLTDNGGGVVTVSAQNKTLDVITDISFAFNGDNQLVATITKQTITVLDKTTQTGETTATIPLWKQDVVIASEYSTSTHAFKNTTLGGVRTVETLPSQPSQTTVFTATAHSGQ